MQLSLLLLVNVLHSCCSQECLSVLIGIGLQEAPILQLSISDVDVSVSIWELFCSQPLSFSLVNGTAGYQLETGVKSDHKVLPKK